MTFDWFTHFCREISSSRFTHFFRRFFEIEKWNPQTFLLLECMHDDYIGHNDHDGDGGDAEAPDDEDVNHEHQGY